MKGFLKDLMKVGPHSKQILNYSYPPLLYQRGDDSEEEMEEEVESEEDSLQDGFQLDEHFDMEHLLEKDLDDLDEHNGDLKRQEMEGMFDEESPDAQAISDIQRIINQESPEGQNFDDLEPEEMMAMLEKEGEQFDLM